MAGEHGTGGGRAGRVVGTLLKISAGAGLVVVGAYVVSRVTQKRAMEARVERLEAMVAALEKQGGEARE